MSKRYFIFIFVVVLVLFALSGAVIASDPVYINSSDGLFDGLFSSLYATGSGGVALISTDNVWALTGDGLAYLGEDTPDDPGSGLEYTNGSISIKSNTVKVGLKYYYSSSRDSSLEQANLENAVGSGYAFGYYDASRVFHEIDRTGETKISMRITSGTAIGVYITGTDTLLYEHKDTSAANMLAVMPLSSSGEAVTWFAGYKYYGGFEYAALGGEGITVINVVNIEKYVMGVCGSEMSDSWPLEALKAQAVCARTYAQKLIKNSTYYTRCGFDLTNDTYCQAYSGCSRVGLNIEAAVLATANQYITYNGAYIDALYFSSDGGATESNVNVNGNDYHPYLKGKPDPYEALSNDINPYSKWTRELTPAVLGGKVGLKDVKTVVPTLSETGNVIKLVLTASDGSTATLERDACRTVLGMFSLRYTISITDKGNFLFTGSGWGHSLGLSQYGAYSMARYYELTYKDILGFYYTGVGLSYGV